MKTARRTIMHWTEECKYIDRVADRRGYVETMGYSLDTFIAYCEMQRDVAIREGYDDAVMHIQHVIDDMARAA